MNEYGRRSTTFSIFVIVSLVAYGGMVALQRQTGGLLQGRALLGTVLLALLAFCAYVGILVWSERRRGFPLKWIWLTAVGFRLLFLMAKPALSDDIFRYMWDGHLAQNGISPYAHRVEANELDHVEIPQRGMVNHCWMASPYLPGAQLLFQGIETLFPRQTFFYQLAMILLDLLGALLLSRLMALASIRASRILIYLLNP